MKKKKISLELSFDQWQKHVLSLVDDPRLTTNLSSRACSKLSELFSSLISSDLPVSP